MKTIYFQEVPLGLNVFIDGKLNFVPKTHAFFDEILTNLRTKAFASIEDLINNRTPKILVSKAMHVDAVTASRATVPLRNRRVFIFDNGSWRGVVYEKNKNEFHDKSDVFIATGDNPNLKIRSARTRTVEKLLLAIPKQSREKFYIKDSPNVQLSLKAMPAARVQPDSIELRVKKVIAEQLGLNEAEVKENNHVVNDLGADSLDTVEMVMALEDEFGTYAEDEEIENLYTVAEIIKFVRSKVKS